MTTVKKSILTIAATAAIMFGGLGVVTATTAGASTIPVTASPSTGLTDGQSVQVSATGLTPGSSYGFDECAYVGTNNQLACAQDTVPVTADANGNASSSLTVHESFQAYVGGTLWGTIDCSTTQCYAGIGDSSGDGGGAAISFQ